jgi:peptidyl-prolyl cis-trans isomerase-like 4
MDKCLIDDSRIHCDFSQSVAKVDRGEDKRGEGEDFGGEGLRRKKQYRNDDRSRHGKDYDMVWEKREAEAKEEKEVTRGRESSRSISPQRREKSRSPRRRRSRSRSK